MEIRHIILNYYLIYGLIETFPWKRMMWMMNGIYKKKYNQPLKTSESSNNDEQISLSLKRINVHQTG